MLDYLKLHNHKGSVAAAILLFFYADPYFFWGGIYQNNYTQFLLGIMMLYLFLKNKTFHGLTKALGVFFVLLIVMDMFLQGRNIMYLLFTIPVAALPFADKEFTQSTYNNFLNIYCGITFVSLAIWVLHLVGAAPYLGTIPPLNQLKSHSYDHYPFLVTVSGSYRFECVFDEPGVVGTLSGMLLCIQRFNFKDRRNYILLASGLCSMSMFFYIMIASYGVLYYIIEKKSIFKTVLMAVAVFGLLYVVQNIPVLNEIIGGRLEWDAEKMSFAGDNRTKDSIIDYFDSIIGTNEFWYGLDNKALFLESVVGECNVYITILVNGALFCLLYLGFMISYGLHFKKTWAAFILFLFVFLICVYQRPFLFEAVYVFLWCYMAKIDRNNDFMPPQKL